MRRTSWLFAILAVLLFLPAGQASLEDQPPPGETAAELASLAAVGDLNFAGGLGRLILSEGPDYPWRATADLLAATDILLGNLEVPLSLRGKVYTPKKWTLHADPRTVAALVSGGFDVVSLANNHAMDFGPAALAETIALLDEHGIGHAGAGADLAEARAPCFIARNGLNVAFLSYSLTFPTEFYAGKNRPGTAPGYENYLRADIPAARSRADLVVVSFHWSGEMYNYPKDYQRRLGRLAIDLGAGLVVGHHPHVLQGLEVYKGGLIAYSLGNFAFGSLSAKCRDSIILTVGFDRAGLDTAWLHPVNVNNYEVAFQTRPRKGADAARVIADLRRFSAAFGTEIASDGDRGVIQIRR